MAKPWMIDELAHAGPEHLDPDFVIGYDRKQGFPDFTPDAEALAVGPTVIDLGCGTGRFAIAAAPLFERVVAVDVSTAMVNHARTQTAHLPNVEVVHAGFFTYRHDGPPADAVHTRNALHQLPDFWKALALQRIASLLRPGGLLRLRDLVYDFHPDQTDEALDAWLAGGSPNPAAGYTADDFADHVRTEHSTFRWLLEPMLDATGFDIVDAEYGRRVYASYLCRRR